VAVGVCLLLGAVAQAGAADLASGQPLSADDCVRIALQTSDELAQARAREATARGNALSSYSAVLPMSGASASWSRQYEIYPPPGGVTYSGSVGLSASQTIFDLGEICRLRRARQGLRAAGADLKAAENDIGVAVRQQFHVCVAASRLADVETRAAELAREQLRRSETLFQLGSVARSDVLQAQVNLADAEQTATQRRNAVPIELGRLVLSMGLDPLTTVAVDTAVVVPADDPAGGIDGYVRRAHDRRPELAAARARLRAAHINEAAAKYARLPTITGRAGWSRSAIDELDAGFGSEYARYRNTWSASLSLSLPLFTGLQIEGAIEAAKGDRRGQEAALRQLEKNVTLQVKEAYLQIFNEREALRAARSSVSLARENLRLQQALYESGAGTLLEWDNARLNLRRAEVAQIQAELSLALAHARFRRATGE
jgi:outer membrane protein